MKSISKVLRTVSRESQDSGSDSGLPRMDVWVAAATQNPDSALLTVQLRGTAVATASSSKRTTLHFISELSIPNIHTISAGWVHALRFAHLLWPFSV